MRQHPFTIAIILLLAGGVPAFADSQPCTLKLAASLDARTEPDGRITIPAMVENRPVRLTADTGGIYAALDPAVADELHLSRAAAPQEFLAGNLAMAQVVTAKTFDVGRLHSENFRFVL